MTIEERVLTALRCGQPDRVPVSLFLNPYADNWDSSYAEVLKACAEMEDVIFEWSFPHGLFFTTAGIEKEQRQLNNESIETISNMN